MKTDGKIYSTALLGASPTSVRTLVDSVQDEQVARAEQRGPAAEPGKMVVKDGMVVVVTVTQNQQP